MCSSQTRGSGSHAESRASQRKGAESRQAGQGTESLIRGNINTERLTVPVVNAQSYLLSILDDLPMPYGKPAARAYVTPPDPRVQAKIPAIYIWPSDGEENRSPELGGTIPRNTGPGTSSGTKGILHKMDVYLTWFSAVA